MADNNKITSSMLMLIRTDAVSVTYRNINILDVTNIKLFPPFKKTRMFSIINMRGFTPYSIKSTDTVPCCPSRQENHLSSTRMFVA